MLIKKILDNKYIFLKMALNFDVYKNFLKISGRVKLKKCVFKND